MAIATDAFTGVKAVTNNGSFTHTCTGTNLILVVGVATSGTTDNITGVTYNSVALTRAGTVSNGTDVRVYIYYLVNPSTGLNTVAFTQADTAVGAHATAGSYTGALGGFDNFGSTATTASGNITASVTVGPANCWLVETHGAHLANPGSVVSGTERSTISALTDGDLADSNAVVGTGAQTIGYNWGASDTVAIAAISISPTSTGKTASVFDSATIAETTTALLKSNVNVFDSVTIAETVTAKIPSGNANVFDSVNVSESTTPQKVNTVSVFDNATIAETTTPQQVNNTGTVFDSATIAESITATSGPLFVNLFDSVTISETITTIEKNLVASVADNIAVSESDVLMEIEDESIVDIINISESTTPSLTNYINIFDSVTISESSQPQKTSFVSVFDNATVAETLAFTSLFLIQLNELINVSEQVGIFQSLFAYTENWTSEVENSTNWIPTTDTSTNWEDPL